MDYEINREQIVNKNTPEAIERLKKGFCPICGVDKTKFHKRMRAYCSPEHREQYYKNIFTWEEMRNRILARDNKTCQICQTNLEKSEKERETLRNEKFLEEGKKYPDEMELVRRHLLEEADTMYANALDDEFLALRVGRNKLHWDAGLERFYLEVDHIVPIVQGGDMWDEKNLRTLCNKCHKKKTKEDVKNKKLDLNKNELKL